MNKRIERLQQSIQVEKYPICIERSRLITESYKKTEGKPMVLVRAEGMLHLLSNIKIFIEDDELIVGNAASKPMGVEVCPEMAIWSQDEIDSLKREGFSISTEEEEELQSLNAYWKGKTIIGSARNTELFDERIWPFLQSGVSLPPWKTKEGGAGGGKAMGGMGIGGVSLMCVDYAKVLNMGLESVIQEAEVELKNLRFTNAEAIEKAYFLKAVIIANKGVLRFAVRFADLAEEMAAKEKNQTRKQELERIAETCRRVPSKPARTFYEALQSFWFIFLMVAPSSVVAGGRFDQYMYPFYKKDKETGIINDDEVLELLQCLRIKDMQINRISGKTNRKKNAGMAKWHNFIIGGVTPEGEDATNDLSYLLLEAAMRCRTPHHTITLRVHDKTPDALMMKALELVRTGMGMPAFLGDKSHIEHIMSRGVDLETARDYVVTGCVETSIAGGRGRTIGGYKLTMTRILEATLNNGYDTLSGKVIGPRTGDVDSFKTFDDFMNAFKKQFAHYLGLAAESNNIMLKVRGHLTPEPFLSSLMVNAIKEGKDIFDRTFPYEAGAGILPVGMINVVDSLAAMKKLVFDDKKVSMKTLKAALDGNWQGNEYEEIRKLCLKAPKYGNDDDYVDSIAKELYQFFCDETMKHDTIFGGKHIPAAISISSHWPGGEISGASPDGRFAGEVLADAAVSAMRGMDTQGPTALIKSAAKVNQVPFQSVLFNMKFHPSALKTDDDLLKLSSLIKTYVSMGGRHVQFNVADKDSLIEAQQNPEQHRDLIVRVAGYSAYFVTLGTAIQDDVINRTEHCLN